jgi:hypothetical protein
MNDSIQTQGNEVAIVIYDAPLPPKYFRLSKRFLKTLFITIPILTGLIILALFLWGLAAQVQGTKAPKIPQIIPRDDKESLLQSEVTSLQESNRLLQEKLSMAPATVSTEDPFLGPIKKPFGMQNLLKDNLVTLDQFDLSVTDSKVSLKFQIISSTPENRVTGHILVLMISEAGLLAYPKAANAALAQGIKFNVGEPFSVSRLRPTNAEFVKPQAEKARFGIYIFNREGDLIAIRDTEEFNLGKKP